MAASACACEPKSPEAPKLLLGSAPCGTAALVPVMCTLPATAAVSAQTISMHDADLVYNAGLLIYIAAATMNLLVLMVRCKHSERQKLKGCYTCCMSHLQSYLRGKGDKHCQALTATHLHKGESSLPAGLTGRPGGYALHAALFKQDNDLLVQTRVNVITRLGTGSTSNDPRSARETIQAC